MQHHISVETPLGILRGRDCIFLNKIAFENGTNTLVLNGEITGSLCNPENDKDIPYRLSFSGLLALKMIELDSWDYVGESCFDEVIESDWMHSLGGKVTPKHHHFLLQTYDDVFEVVCEKYDLKIGDISE